MDMKNLIEIKNGRKVPHTFSDGEYDRRLAKLRSHMAEENIDHVLLTSYHNINYYSDFLFCHFGRFYGLVIDGQRSTSISANIDGGQPWRRTVGDNLIYTDW